MLKVVVAGAGILGASAAYELAKKGVEVILVDREEAGQATKAAAGIVCPWLSQRRNKAWYQLAMRGAAYYPSLIESLQSDGETDTGYKKVGAISIHHDEKKLEGMVKRALKRRVTAPEIGDINRLSPEETRRLFPILAEGYGAVHVSGAARVDGKALRNALLRAAQKHGAVLIEGDASLISAGDTVTGVQIGEQDIQADTVIVTTGGWGNEILAPLGINFAVRKQRAQILHLNMHGVSTENWPVVMPPGNHYLLAFPEGKIVAGTTYEDEMESKLKPEVTAGGIMEILKKAFDTAPALYESTVTETRAGYRPFTPGFLPVFGKLPSHKRILVGNGLGATGLTMGPYIGSLLAKMAVQEPLDIDTSEYDPALAIL